MPRVIDKIEPNDSFPVADADDIAVDASGFDGQLATTDDTVQKVAQKVDDLTVGAGGLTQPQVDARVVAGTLAEARAGNTDRWPASKVPVPNPVVNDVELTVTGNDLTITAGRSDSATALTDTVTLPSGGGGTASQLATATLPASNTVAEHVIANQTGVLYRNEEAGGGNRLEGVLGRDGSTAIYGLWGTGATPDYGSDINGDGGARFRFATSGVLTGSVINQLLIPKAVLATKPTGNKFARVHYVSSGGRQFYEDIEWVPTATLDDANYWGWQSTDSRLQVPQANARFTLDLFDDGALSTPLNLRVSDHWTVFRTPALVDGTMNGDGDGTPLSVNLQAAAEELSGPAIGQTRYELGITRQISAGTILSLTGNDLSIAYRDTDSAGASLDRTQTITLPSGGDGGGAGTAGVESDLNIEQTTVLNLAALQTDPNNLATIPDLTMNIAGSPASGGGFTLANDEITITAAGTYTFEWAIELIHAASGGSTTVITSTDGGSRMWPYSWIEMQASGSSNWVEPGHPRQGFAYSKVSPRQGPSRNYTSGVDTLVLASGDKVRLRIGGWVTRMQFITALARTGGSGVVRLPQGAAAAQQVVQSTPFTVNTVFLWTRSNTQPVPGTLLSGVTYNSDGVQSLPANVYERAEEATDPGSNPGTRNQPLWQLISRVTFDPMNGLYSFARWDVIGATSFAFQFSTSELGTSPHTVPTASDRYYRTRDSAGTWSVWLPLTPRANWEILGHFTTYTTERSGNAGGTFVISIPGGADINDYRFFVIRFAKTNLQGATQWADWAVIPSGMFNLVPSNTTALVSGGSLRMTATPTGLGSIAVTDQLPLSYSDNDVNGQQFLINFRRASGQTTGSVIDSIAFSYFASLRSYGQVEVRGF